MASDTDDLVRSEGDRLFGLAYRMLGSVTEAQDAVQEAFLRWARSDQSQVREPAGWLTTTLTRLCVDQLRSARHRRETYVGDWLPEPLSTGDDPAEAAGMSDSLTMAFLVVLEALSPLERAAFLLHDVFGHEFDEVAAMLDRTPAAVRKLASRARGHVEERANRHRADRAQARAVTDAFLQAVAGDDLDTMMELLAPDVVFVGDGGGLATAVPAPVHGADRVGGLLRSFWKVGLHRGYAAETVEVNAEPALWVRDGDETSSILVFEVSDGRISAIRGLRNPHKLAVFRPLA